MRNTYLLVSGIIFGIVAALQILRAVNQWPIQIDGTLIPVWISWIAGAVTTILCVWAFRSRE
jgi:uncharacterized membrane protein YhaH (DUF805 family)